MSAPSAASRFCNCQTKSFGTTHDGTPGEAASVGGKLVALAVTRGRGATRRLTEGAVEAARKLGRVRHECDTVSVTILHEGSLDGADAAVHHVTRSDTVRAGLGISQSDLGDALGRRLSVQGRLVRVNGVRK